MRILVLGSAGQIGAALVQHLRSINHEVIEFDIFTDEGEDLRIESILDDLLPAIDFVFFLAFDVGGSHYLQKYQHTYDFVNNNVKLMAYTFDSLKKFNTKFLFASSQMSNMLYSPYGVLKKMGETYTEILGGLVVKFWNVYGYEADLNKSHVITDFIRMAKIDGSINMRTDGLEERQFLYADDCCECLSILMNRYDEIDRSKNLHITNFEWTRIIDIASIIFEMTQKDKGECKVIPAEASDTVQLDKRNEPDDYILGFWRPKTSLEEGIKILYNKY
jgi:nucleoside-diphosphate-sugar epimerase